MKRLRLKKTAVKGFSLVEMLVVIAVIGVIAAIAIPSIGNINGAAKTTTDQRNAQSIIEVYQAGLAAGITWPAFTTSGGLVSDVVTGVKAGSGDFSGMLFQVPGIGTNDQASASAYIGKNANGAWTYSPTQSF
jgi:prepilin-type N-terminal cleavage/methylation domain-containing protein